MKIMWIYKNKMKLVINVILRAKFINLIFPEMHLCLPFSIFKVY